MGFVLDFAFVFVHVEHVERVVVRGLLDKNHETLEALQSQSFSLRIDPVAIGLGLRVKNEVHVRGLRAPEGLTPLVEWEWWSNFMPWLILVQVKGAVAHPVYQVVVSVRLKVPWASHGRQFTKNSVTPPLLLVE